MNVGIRRRTVAAVSAFILVAGLSSCSGSSSGGSSQSNPLNLITPRVLLVGVTGASKPYVYQDASGNWIGFEPDLVSNVAKRVGIDKVEYAEQDLSSLLASVASRKYDIAAAGIGRTAAREQTVDFCSDYLNGYATFIAKPSEVIKSAASLAGKRVGLVTFTVEEQYVQEKIPLASVVEFPDENAAVQALLSGTVDTVFADESTADSYVKQYPQFVEPYKVMGNAPSAWPISKQDKALEDALDKGMAEAIADGTVERLTKKWLPGNPIFPQYMPKS